MIISTKVISAEMFEVIPTTITLLEIMLEQLCIVIFNDIHITQQQNIGHSAHQGLNCCLSEVTSHYSLTSLYSLDILQARLTIKSIYILAELNNLRLFFKSILN